MSTDLVVLGIDQGLSGARAAVMTTDGRVIGRGRAACLDTRLAADGLEHDPAGWLDESTAAARMALDEAGVSSVEAIGIGALGPAPILLDGSLRPLTPSPLFPTEPTRPFGPWKNLDPDLAGRAAWLVDLCGFLVSSLVGKPVMDRITAGDYAIADDWPRVRMPEPSEPFAVAGRLTAEAASRLRLATGTPVAVGTYDTFVDLAALQVLDPGDRGILLGSTLIVGAVRRDDRAPDGLRASRHAGSGWFVGGWTQAAGRALSWWLGLFPPDRREAIMRDAGELPPGAGGLLALPYLDGERAPVWDPSARGAFVGITTKTTATQLYRAMIDAVALSAADLARRLHPPEPDDQPWHLAGGGAQDPAWLQATVDAIGDPVHVADLGAAGGAARSALHALDLPAPALAMRLIDPDAERHARYARLLVPYRALHGALGSTLGALAAVEAAP